MEQYKVPMSVPDITEHEVRAATQVLAGGWCSLGKVTDRFEKSLAHFIGSEVHVVNNGSSALLCALVAHGVRAGDRVLVPDFTFVATASIPKLLGARVLVADVDPYSFNMTPESVERFIKEHGRVKAVVAVDVGGLPIDVEGFQDLSRRYGFIFIEDAAEALGAEYQKKRLGSFRHLTLFSFQIAKQLTTIEGGCLASQNNVMISRCRKISNYGRSTKGHYVHDLLGMNLRTTDVQSAIGLVQLQKLESYLQRRQQIAVSLALSASSAGLLCQTVPSYVTRHGLWMLLYQAESHEDRDRILTHLKSRGIDAREPFMPIHMQPCFPELRSLKMPNSTDIYKQALALPIYNTMSDRELTVLLDALDSLRTAC